MLRSAANAGASIADARPNATAAVLAHRDFFVPSLNQTLPALARTETRAPNGPANRYARPQRGSISLQGSKADFRKVWRQRHSLSFPAVLQPIFQVLSRHCSLAFIVLLDPPLFPFCNPPLFLPP